MKHILTIFTFLLCVTTNAQDKLIKLSGDTLNVKITKSTENYFEFQYPNEDIINTVNKTKVKKIIYSSGRTEEVNQKIPLNTINDKNDWEKVFVTYNKDDVEGLEVFKTISKSSLWGGSLGSNIGHNEVVKKLQKEAAKNKCRAVLITDNPSKHSAAMGGGVKLNATIYK